MDQRHHYLKQGVSLMWNRLGKGGTRYWGKKGAGSILTDGKVILLLKRGSKSDFAGYWSLPGGKVEEGETFLGGAQRETREETGTMPTCTRVASFDNQDGRFIFKSFLFKIDKPYVVKISDEHTDAKWVPLNEINNLKLHPKLREIMPSILRTIHEKISGNNTNESVFHTGAIMKIGPFAIWEMQKYINKHSKNLAEGWWPSKTPDPQPNDLPPITTLAPRKVNAQITAFLPHIAAELELPTPLKPEVNKALLEIVSRVAPEPFGTGGMLRLNWFKIIIISVYQNYIDECKANGITPDPNDHRLMIAKNPVQLLHAIRSAMPQERFHSNVTLEGGGSKNGAAHDEKFIHASNEFESEIKKTFFPGVDSHNPNPKNNSNNNPGPNPKPNSGSGSKSGNISGVPVEMMNIIRAMPATSWYDGNNVKSDGDLNSILNSIHMLSGSANYSPDAKTINDLRKFISTI